MKEEKDRKKREKSAKVKADHDNSTFPVSPGEEAQFEQLCRTHLTLREIAAAYKTVPSELNRWTKERYGRTFADEVYHLRVDRQTFEKLCGLHCTETEIASFFYVPVEFINEWCKETYEMTFSEAFTVFSSSGKIRLRRLQFQLAEKSASMAIFLGRVILGQRDDTVIQDEDAMKAINEQAQAIADLINAPVEERSMSQVDEYRPESDA